MGMSEENIRIVKLTKFKKMSSTQDLHMANDSSGEVPTNEGSSSTCDVVSGSSDTPVEVVDAEGQQSSATIDESVNAMEVDKCVCTTSNQGASSSAVGCSVCSQSPSPGKIRTRRKSWCVESSIKKQFQRNSELRRTLERSQGLPPLLESQSSSPAFVSSSIRLAGLIDQRLRRLRISSSKAMTLAIPSERRRMRPSIFDSSRRKSEAGIPLTLASLKARRKSEGGLLFEGIKFLPDKLKSSKLSTSLTNSVIPVARKSDFSHVLRPARRLGTVSLFNPPSEGNKKDANSWTKDLNEGASSEGGVVQEILSFNSRSIFDNTPTNSPKTSLTLPSYDECDCKFESEKSLSLLPGEEHFDVCSEASEDTQDLAKNLRRHITSFADRLHLTKDRLEDTAKCYLLLDKAYEWALEAMKVVGRVKSSGTATLEQVGAAAEAIGELLRENPPVSEDTFTAMLDLATKLDNQTLLQQCKMAHARCKETISLLRNRQSALLKARHQMEFDCQSFVDLNEILSLPEESSYFPPSAWPPGIAHSSACRRRSVCSLNSSRPRDPISRCSSIETDDDSVFSESPFSSTPSKTPLEGKSSLRGIKELRESDENLRGTSAFIRGNANFFRSSIGSEMRISINDSCPLSNSPSTINNITGSNTRAFSSGSSSSCSSSESSGPISGVKKDRNSLWRFTDLVPNNIEEANDSLEDQINLANLSAGTNSHLLIRGSQINLSNSENLTQEEVRKNKTLLLIMQELIQTERDYVNSLEYIIENFLPELLREDIPQALRGQRNVIFGNIEKIYEFHSGYFVKELENCRSRPFAVGSIFLRYENQFYLYALYNKNKPKSDELMADFGSLFFKRKQMMLGDKMDLSSYLLKPVQRMGKYALLLKQLLKECEKSEEGYDELKSAQEMVQFQLRHGNDLLAMDSLRDCDVNLKEQGRLLRQGEFLVTEGSRGRKSLRHVFLFEDLILFSKSRKDPEKKNLDIFQYKQSLKTTDIGLTAQVGESPLRFEIWFRKRKPSDTFHFQSNSLEVKEAWTEEISKLLWRQALRNRKLRLHEMSSMGIGNKPCLDIRPSEDQISDRSVCIGKAPPRLRLSTSASLTDATSGVRRPHSVISVSSSASSAESSTNSSAGPSFVGTLNLGFESGDSPKPLQRSVTRTSQCSAESGIITDIFPERESEESHSKVERSNSTVTNTSVDSALSPPTLLTHCQSSPLSALEEPSNTELPVDITPTEQVKIVLTTEV